MKLKKVLLLLSWFISCIGFIMYLISEKSLFLLLISLGMGIISLLEYEKLKINNDLSYVNLRLVFIYIIFALFSLYIFIFDKKIIQ